MSVLFEKSTINGLELANRFIRSATWEGLADKDGSVTPVLIDKMKELAAGGVGMIISGHAYVQFEGMAGPCQLGVYKDELQNGLKALTHAVHKYDGKIVLQLAHAGNFSYTTATGKLPQVVSDFTGLADTPRIQLTQEDIKNLVGCFADAARRAKESGFDGVQIHSAHGYLLSQFLSPYYNKRDDEYGGSLENRSRIHMEILKAIRAEVGTNFPIFIKLNCQDFDENGLNLEDAIQVGKFLAQSGLDAIELSGGLLSGGRLSPSRSRINSADDEAYFREQARAFKKEIGIPLILVGGIRSLQVANELVSNGTADYLAMSRPLIREPDLIKRWKSGQVAKAACKSDNLCFGAAFKGGVYCVSEARERNKQE